MLRGSQLQCTMGLLGFAVSSCFMGYDSRWGQQKQVQKHLAAHMTPHELRGNSLSAGGRVAQRTLKLRVYATPGYASNMLDWQKQFGKLLDCANSVFVPDFGVAFEVVETRNFRPKANEEKLDGMLDELVELDSAEDVDWVIGLATSIPRFAVSADDLG